MRASLPTQPPPRAPQITSETLQVIVNYVEFHSAPGRSDKVRASARARPHARTGACVLCCAALWGPGCCSGRCRTPHARMHAPRAPRMPPAHPADRCMHRTRTQERKQYDERLVKMETKRLCELTSAADSLEMRPLVDITSRGLARLIEGKSPEEIREAFNLPDDLTEEEVRRRSSSGSVAVAWLRAQRARAGVPGAARQRAGRCALRAHARALAYICVRVQKLEPVKNLINDPRIRLLNRLYAKKRKVGVHVHVTCTARVRMCGRCATAAGTQAAPGKLAGVQAVGVLTSWGVAHRARAAQELHNKRNEARKAGEEPARAQDNRSVDELLSFIGASEGGDKEGGKEGGGKEGGKAGKKAKQKGGKQKDKGGGAAKRPAAPRAEGSSDGSGSDDEGGGALHAEMLGVFGSLSVEGLVGAGAAASGAFAPCCRCCCFWRRACPRSSCAPAPRSSRDFARVRAARPCSSVCPPLPYTRLHTRAARPRRTRTSWRPSLPPTAARTTRGW